ncbi:MAG: molybdopterin-dependent oxidoreductase, partial [Rhodospirillales bacterium]|nr:molybdopterin-dependent oxidoreductase [Rhodospirillales bacterium]
DDTPTGEATEAPKAQANAARTLEATYTRPFQMHASLGPSAAVAVREHSRLTVWTASQGIFPLRAELARVLGMAEDEIRVVHADGAGCYGHNGADDAALDAAVLAGAVPGRPVKLQWTRADESAYEPYATPMAVRMRGSLDGGGRVVDWNHDVWTGPHVNRPLRTGTRARLIAAREIKREIPMAPPEAAADRHGGGQRNADPLYRFPEARIVKHFVADVGLPTSSFRGLGAFANVFAIESFMDELAVAAGVDPVEFRLRHLEDSRARAVIEAVAEACGWGSPMAEGVGRGLAFARYKNAKCYAAVVIETRVDPETFAIGLSRAWIAADAGRIVNPDGLANQLEGGLVFAASQALMEEVDFDRTAIVSLDWESYPILKMGDAPEIETVLIDRPDAPPLGAGEAVQGPTPAAIANGVFDAIGVRLRDIPFTPARVRDASLVA